MPEAKKRRRRFAQNRTTALASHRAPPQISFPGWEVNRRSRGGGPSTNLSGGGTLVDLTALIQNIKRQKTLDTREEAQNVEEKRRWQDQFNLAEGQVIEEKRRYDQITGQEHADQISTVFNEELAGSLDTTLKSIAANLLTSGQLQKDISRSEAWIRKLAEDEASRLDLNDTSVRKFLYDLSVHNSEREQNAHEYLAKNKAGIFEAQSKAINPQEDKRRFNEHVEGMAVSSAVLRESRHNAARMFDSLEFTVAGAHHLTKTEPGKISEAGLALISRALKDGVVSPDELQKFLTFAPQEILNMEAGSSVKDAGIDNTVAPAIGEGTSHAAAQLAASYAIIEGRGEWLKKQSPTLHSAGREVLWNIKSEMDGHLKEIAPEFERIAQILADASKGSTLQERARAAAQLDSSIRPKPVSKGLMDEDTEEVKQTVNALSEFGKVMTTSHDDYVASKEGKTKKPSPVPENKMLQHPFVQKTIRALAHHRDPRRLLMELSSSNANLSKEELTTFVSYLDWTLRSGALEDVGGDPRGLEPTMNNLQGQVGQPAWDYTDKYNRNPQNPKAGQRTYRTNAMHEYALPGLVKDIEGHLNDLRATSNRMALAPGMSEQNVLDNINSKLRDPEYRKAMHQIMKSGISSPFAFSIIESSTMAMNLLHQRPDGDPIKEQFLSQMRDSYPSALNYYNIRNDPTMAPFQLRAAEIIKNPFEETRLLEARALGKEMALLDWMNKHGAKSSQENYDIIQAAKAAGGLTPDITEALQPIRGKHYRLSPELQQAIVATSDNQAPLIQMNKEYLVAQKTLITEKKSRLKGLKDKLKQTIDPKQDPIAGFQERLTAMLQTIPEGDDRKTAEYIGNTRIFELQRTMEALKAVPELAVPDSVPLQEAPVPSSSPKLEAQTSTPQRVKTPTQPPSPLSPVSSVPPASPQVPQSQVPAQ